MKKRSVVIGCDNAAVELKKTIMGIVQGMGYTVEDVGVDDVSDQTLYPIIADRLCQRIIDSDYSKLGILLCGTGIGMAMTANNIRRSMP